MFRPLNYRTSRLYMQWSSPLPTSTSSLKTLTASLKDSLAACISCRSERRFTLSPLPAVAQACECYVSVNYPRHTICGLRCVARCPVHGVQQSEWSACPPDVLQQCLSAQPDYLDNGAAACVSKLWRDTFRCARKLIIVYSALRPRPRPLYLC